jgi:5-methyltetrahydrofolate--homocysteine methyltransferase
VAEGTFETQGKVVIGTVQGDLHDLGKNIVKMMLEGASFEVVDAGIDVSAAQFVELVREEEPGVIGLSALLTTTMPAMRDVIISLREAGLRDQIRVIIGGGPVTLNYADDIGADGYAPDAPQAVTLVKGLMGLSGKLRKMEAQ